MARKFLLILLAGALLVIVFFAWAVMQRAGEANDTTDAARDREMDAAANVAAGEATNGAASEVTNGAADAAANGAGEEAAVVAAAQAFLDALQAKDPLSLARTMIPTGAIHSVDMRPGRESQPIRGRTVDVDAASLAGGPEALLERMWDPVVRIHGRIATVWAPYDFWIDQRFSHCGVDVFTLMKAEGAWRIASITYTVESEDCPPSPLGAVRPE